MQSIEKLSFHRSSRRKILCLSATSMLTGGFISKCVLAADDLTIYRSAVATESHSKSVDAAVAALDTKKLVKLAMGLTDIPSPLGSEEKAAQFFYDRMKNEGLIARLQPFAVGRSNAIGIHRGTGGGRSLMLNGHLETGSLTAEHSFLPSKLVDGKWICGQGIWNMKGALAAYVTAVSAIHKAGIVLAGDVLITAVAGAWDQSPVDTRIKTDLFQGYGVGTKYMLDHGGATADFAVVGEPTSFKLVRQQFGTTLARIDVDTSTPSNVPEVFADYTGDLGPFYNGGSIEYAAEIVKALNVWSKDYKLRNKVAGVPPWARVTAIEGGDPGTPNAATRCTIFVTVNTPPNAAPGAVLGELRRVLSEVRSSNPGLNATAELYATNPGPSVPENSPLIMSLHAAHTDTFGHAPEEAVVQWISDASPLTHFGVPAVNYGPTGMIKASEHGTPHGKGEFVRIIDLVNCTRVYIDLIIRMCGALSVE